MAHFDGKTLETVKRLQNARIRLLRTQPFYAILLLHMTFSLDTACDTAYTDGTRIAFNPDFISNLDDRELEFVLIHEVLHVALRHCFHDKEDLDQEYYNIACDIVVNSNILYSFGMDPASVTLKKYGELIHQTPSGDEGYNYSVNEVYKMITDDVQRPHEGDKSGGSGDKSSDDNNENSDDDSGKSDGDNSGGNGKPGNSDSQNQSAGGAKNGRFDEHDLWDGKDEDGLETQTWLQRMVDATEMVSDMYGGMGCGNIPARLEREIKDFKEPQTDWRTVLENFIQEEINDYSFSPPDRRFTDSPFFLPDYNEKEEYVHDILFMVDTSASMSDEMITEAYSEIKGAIDQFGGKLVGWLGFFDATVIEPVPFENEDEFKIIRPVGGGGTDFGIIFEYVHENMKDHTPASIVILTDGYAPFPKESEAHSIPVLWLINNEEADPPWGKVTRIKSYGRS